MKSFLTFDEVDVHQRSPLTIKVSREMLHFLVLMLDFIQMRCVGALHDPDVQKKPIKTLFTLPVINRKITESGDIKDGHSLLQQRFGGLSEER